MKYKPLKGYFLKLPALAFLFFASINSHAQQTKVLSVQEAIELGMSNSKALKLSKVKIDEAISRYHQTADEALPKASASYAYNHANFLSSEFKLSNDPDSKALKLPSSADAFIGTVSVQQLLFAGNKLRYAKESTNILTEVAKLDADRQQDAIAYSILNACYNLYRVQQSQNIIKQNAEAVTQQLLQAQQFFKEGLVTKNDVLRFQLQQNNVQLTALDLETNKKIVNYNLNILLGLPENTEVQIKFDNPSLDIKPLSAYVDSAITNREDIKVGTLRTTLAESNIKSLKADYAPVIGTGLNLYYINPSGKFIPPSKSFLAPVALGATISWNIDKIWTNKNKISEARIQQSEASLNAEQTTDNVKTEVNEGYQNYRRSLDRIKILELSIEQAKENDRILESKYRNNIASATDRIDAETQLYQALINLELAKADAGLAYYNLLKTTGTLTQHNL